METITLNNGVEMPALGLGVFQTPPDETRDAVRSALGAAYRLIDTAAAYGNEMAAIDSLDTHRRGGPEPDAITLEAFGREIPEAGEPSPRRGRNTLGLA